MAYEHRISVIFDHVILDKGSYLNQGIHGLAKNSFSLPPVGLRHRQWTVVGLEFKISNGFQPRILENLPDTISKNILSSFWVEKFYYIHCSQINLNGSFKKMNVDVYSTQYIAWSSIYKNVTLIMILL